METKNLSEIALLKLQNANLKLQILQLQANQIVAERDKVIADELKALNCDPAEWEFNPDMMAFVKKSDG